jgi:quinol monooxygenase YgiN
MSGGTRVIATFRARPGREAELFEVLEKLVEPTRRENGCRRYELWRNRADAAELTFVEEWTSDERSPRTPRPRTSPSRGLGIPS